MSNAVSALQGKSFDGPVTVREDGLRGMISLRGDLDDAALRKVCTGLTGVDFPNTGQANSVAQQGLCWMSPDEVLILVAYDQLDDALAKIHTALSGKHYLATNVSDARAVFIVQGPFVREVLAKLAPVDLSPAQFQPGTFRRTHLGQIAAAFWMVDDSTIAVICFRSVADYTFGLLAASVQGGPVGHF